MQSLFISSSKKSSGKTILSIGLAALAHQEKLNTQTFKKGPDFIDPSWLNAASNNPCYNLDFNTMSRDEIKDLYNSKSKNSDFTVIEGTKGLFDGVAIDGSDSNAALAKIIKTEVVLIIDCQGITRGIAPLLNGYRSFDKQLNLTKVILNNVSNTRHEDKLICSIKEYTNFKCYGAIPKINDIIDERHLGLVPAFQHDNRKKILATLRNNLKSCIEYKKLIPAPKKNKSLINKVRSNNKTRFTIGVASDQAFGFYYPDDIEKFKDLGCKIKKINFIKDKYLPNIDGLIIGGGFPETVAEKLESNQSMKSSLKKAIESNLPVYAECGGLMYLCKYIEFHGRKRKMCNVLDINVKMNSEPIGRGLTVLVPINHPWKLGSVKIPAHEFHYSSLEFNKKKYNFAYKLSRGYGINGKQDGLMYKNVIASYSHLRSTQNFQWVESFLNFIDNHHG